MNAQSGQRRAHRLGWFFYAPLAMASELGLPRHRCSKLARLVGSRLKVRLMVVAMLTLVPIASAWYAIFTLGTFYLATYQFTPTGSPSGSTATGPFGLRGGSLLMAYLLVFGGGWLVASLAMFAVYDAIIGRELRRCIRTPACFTCGYDLSAVVGNTCPECGTARVASPPTRTVTP